MHICYLSYWDTVSTTQSLCLVQYGLKNWTDSSMYSPFTLPSTMIEMFVQEKKPVTTLFTTVLVPSSLLLPSKTSPVPQMSPGSSDTQSSSSHPAQQKLKLQKYKMKNSCTCTGIAWRSRYLRPKPSIWGIIAWFRACSYGVQMNVHNKPVSKHQHC